VPFSTAGCDAMLNAWAASDALYISLHSAYSASGANELTGGSPAYARQAATWGSAASNSMTLSGTYTWNVPASSTVAFIGFWSALTGGVFQGMFPDSAGASPYAFAAPSSTSTLLAPGSAYSATQPVVVYAPAGSSLPSGLTAGTVYFVSSPSSDSFKLAATSGGTAITLTADGSGIVQAIAQETYSSQGTFTLGSGDGVVSLG
jgi:hypothetical protein